MEGFGRGLNLEVQNLSRLKLVIDAELPRSSQVNLKLGCMVPWRAGGMVQPCLCPVPNTVPNVGGPHTHGKCPGNVC